MLKMERTPEKKWSFTTSNYCRTRDNCGQIEMASPSSSPDDLGYENKKLFSTDF